MVRMAGRMKYLSSNADLVEELTALLEGDDDVAILRNINILVPRFCPGLHQGDRINLDIEYKQGTPETLNHLSHNTMIFPFFAFIIEIGFFKDVPCTIV